MLEMRNITKRFDAILALDKAIIKVNEGEIMALLGSNGSGKSTMVKVLSGLVDPNEGEIFIDGKKVIINSPDDARKLGIAVAYQDLSLIPKMSIEENILLGIEPVKNRYAVDKKKVQEIAKENLKKLNLDIDTSLLVEDLMPSTQSLVEVAKALALNPKLLILDEVTATLHSDEVDTLFDMLLKLKEKGTSIIIVTHRMNEIYRICDRCTILKSGKTVAVGNINEMQLEKIVFHMTGKLPDTNENEHQQVKSENTDNELLLEVSNLSMPPKLKNINFKAYKGEIIGIGGLVGQGQSEFIHALLADVKYTSGTITYKGKKVNYKSTAEAMKDDIGFISGDRNRESIFPLRSVAENIFAGNATKGSLFSYLSPKSIEKFALKAMDDYKIVAGSIFHPASSLSGGNQQKLVVGRWLALSPSLLLLDDPTKGVDIHSRREIHRMLKDCLKTGMSIIYVSSDNEELLEISDRIYVFYEGEISAQLVGDNRTEEKLVSAMLGLKDINEKDGEKINEL